MEVGRYYRYGGADRKLLGAYDIRGNVVYKFRGLDGLVKERENGVVKDVKFIDIHYSHYEKAGRWGYCIVGFKGKKKAYDDMKLFSEGITEEAARWWSWIEALKIAKPMIKNYKTKVIRIFGCDKDVVELFERSDFHSDLKGIAKWFSVRIGYYDVEIVEQSENKAYGFVNKG